MQRPGLTASKYALLNMIDQRHITLGDVFTEQQLNRAAEIVSAYQGKSERPLVEHLIEEITEPALDQINLATAQENDPGYWAWMLVYALRNKGKT